MSECECPVCCSGVHCADAYDAMRAERDRLRAALRDALAVLQVYPPARDVLAGACEGHGIDPEGLVGGAS